MRCRVLFPNKRQASFNWKSNIQKSVTTSSTALPCQISSWLFAHYNKCFLPVIVFLSFLCFFVCLLSFPQISTQHITLTVWTTSFLCHILRVLLISHRSVDGLRTLKVKCVQAISDPFVQST